MSRTEIGQAYPGMVNGRNFLRRGSQLHSYRLLVLTLRLCLRFRLRPLRLLDLSPSSSFGKFLENKCIKWIDTRSNGIKGKLWMIWYDFLWWKSCSSFRLYFFCPVQAYKNLEAVRLDRTQGNAMGEFPLLSRPFPFSFLLPSICLHPIPLGKDGQGNQATSLGVTWGQPVVVSEKHARPESLSLSLSSLSASASSPSFSLPFSDSLSDSSMISVAVSPELSFLTTKPLDLLNSCMLSWGLRSTTGAQLKNWNFCAAKNWKREAVKTKI